MWRPLTKQLMSIGLTLCLTLANVACKAKVEASVETTCSGGTCTVKVKVTGTLENFAASTEIQSFDHKRVIDADPEYFSPTTTPGTLKVTVLTDTGVLNAKTFELVYDSSLSGEFTPASSSTVPFVYVPKDRNAVESFILNAISSSTNTVTITVTTTHKFTDQSPAGTHSFYGRDAYSGGLFTDGSVSYVSPGDGGGSECPGGKCPILE